MTSFNRVPVPANYDGTCQLVQPMREMTIMIFNAAVLCQRAYGNPPVWEDGAEHELPPGVAASVAEPCAGVRFRLSDPAGADPAKPAAVTILATPGV